MSERRTQPTVSRQQSLFMAAIILTGIAILAYMAMRDNPSEPTEPLLTPPTTSSPIIATVYGKAITQTDLDLARQAYETSFPDRLPVADETVLNWLIDRKLLSKLANDMRLNDDPDINRQIQFHTETVLSEAASQNLLAIPVPEAELEEFYRNEKIDFQGQVQVKARQIVVPDEAMAVEIIRRLDNGEAFGSLALAYSTDRASREFGGDLGYLNKDIPEPVLADAIFGAEEGARLGPIKSKQGWHVIEIMQRRNRPIQTYENRRSEITKLLQSYALQQKLKDLRDSANISILNTIED